MTKRSKKKGKKKFLLVLYNFINSYERLPTEKECGKSKQSLNYYVRQLKEQDLIYSPSYSIWKTRPKKEIKKNIVSTPDPSRILRMHSIQLICKLPSFEYWGKLKLYLEKKGFDFTVTHNKGIRIEHEEVTYHIFRNSIIMYFPSGWNILASDPEIADSKATARGRKCIDRFRKYLGIDFRIGGDYLLSVCRSHTAWVDNDIAKTAHKRGEKIFVKYKGKLWLIADDSFNVNELEFVDHQEKNRDIKVVVDPFFNKLRDNPRILDDLDQGLGKMLDLLEKQQKVINALVDEKEKERAIQRWIR